MMKRIRTERRRPTTALAHDRLQGATGGDPPVTGSVDDGIEDARKTVRSFDT